MEDKKAFGEFLLKKRKEIGLTQREVADKLFVTESAVSKWERGLSYPDITLLRGICEIFSISEHELLTTNVDIKTRELEKMGMRYIRMVNSYKYLLSAIYIISLVVCFICNIAVEQKLSWFFIVLTAEMVAMSITLLPIMIKANRGLITLGAFFTSLSLLLFTCSIYTEGDWFVLAFVSVLFGLSLVFLPFVLRVIHLPEYLQDKKTLLYFFTETIVLFLLLLTCNLYTKGGWFLTIALPITTFSLTFPWGVMFILRYLKINRYFKAAGCFCLASIFVYFFNGFVSFILNNDMYVVGFQSNLTNWNVDNLNGNINLIIFLVLITMTILFMILGINKGFRKKTTV